MLNEKQSTSGKGFNIQVLGVEKIVSKESGYKAPTYQEIIVSSDESVKKWYQFLITAASNEQKISLVIILIRKLMAKYDVSAKYFADVSYEVVRKEYLADNQMWVPALAFHTKESYLAFTRAAKLSAAQGRSFQITLEDDMRPVSVIVYCKEQLPDSLTPEQIRDHEAVHALDPNLWERNDVDALILIELIATIGELATPNYDSSGAKTKVSFWMSYYREIKQKVSPSLLHILGLEVWESDYSLVELAQATVTFIEKITVKKRNSEIVRMLMSCENFSQVLGKLKLMFPGDYR